MVLKLLQKNWLAASAIAETASILIPPNTRLVAIAAQNANNVGNTRIFLGVTENVPKSQNIFILADGYEDGTSFVCWQAGTDYKLHELRNVYCGFFGLTVGDSLMVLVAIDE